MVVWDAWSPQEVFGPEGGGNSNGSSATFTIQHNVGGECNIVLSWEVERPARTQPQSRCTGDGLRTSPRVTSRRALSAS